MSRLPGNNIICHSLNFTSIQFIFTEHYSQELFKFVSGDPEMKIYDEGEEKSHNR
jgi:hypothetical protein